ncbi:unnamed protein product [Scytosiphon promiscuus]
MGMRRVTLLLLAITAEEAISQRPARCAFQSHRTSLPIAGNSVPTIPFRTATTLLQSRALCGCVSIGAARSAGDVTPVHRAATGVAHEPEATSSSRRAFLSSVAAGVTAWTAAGAVVPGRASCGAPARDVDEVKKGIEKDFLTGRYYVTGDLTPSLYRPDCLFTDPTTRVASVDRYRSAVKLLFDPDNAQVDLLSLEAKDDTHIFAEWRLQGYLKFPWHPYVEPYTGTTLYTLDSDGLITRHEETWSITALDAALATITPTAGPPPAATSS